jgi:hypothetical protein
MSETSMTEDLIACCSFCGKANTSVQRLVAGPGVYICNECIALASWVVEDAAHATPEEASRQRAEHQNPSDEHLLGALAGLVGSARRVEDQLVASISRLRERGTDWPTIADAAGMSVEAARRRLGSAGTE